MSEYGAITPTINGLTMITESVVKKKPIVFTKIAIGDGALTNQNIETLTALIRQKQEAPIHIVTDKGAGLADVSAVITNAGLSTGYYARELGVFAKVGDTGQEKLFAYTNAGANASYSPADGSLDEKLITVTFKIGTGATLKVALDSQVYLTLGNLEEHNTSRSAHADIRAQITSDINAHNSDTSAHTPITDQIKAILGSANWKENPVSNLKDIKNLLGQGAIVASKLDANGGFVKFANGFTIQWGLTWFLNQNTYCDVTLPISCNVLVALCTDDSASTTTRGDEFYVSWNSGFSNNNRTSIRFLTNRGNAGNFTWLCLGIS